MKDSGWVGVVLDVDTLTCTHGFTRNAYGVKDSEWVQLVPLGPALQPPHQYQNTAFNKKLKYLLYIKILTKKYKYTLPMNAHT